MDKELKDIKKIYGEEMMQLCRDLLPDVLEEEGALLEILKEKFAPTHKIGHDIVYNCFKREFRYFIINIYAKKLLARIKAGEDIDISKHSALFQKIVDRDNVEIKPPAEMLDEAGYILKECTTQEEIRKYAKYYAAGEEICTLDGGRLNFSRVFFFIRKDVDKIRRGSFPHPDRDDDYSKSVLCVQFNKVAPNYPTIISRYNMAVRNPNFTCYNDLDNITPGLTESFKKYFGFTFERESTGIKFLYDMNYAPDQNDMFYKMYHEKHGLIFCENNIVIRWHDADYRYAAKERYIFMDEYVLDRKEKKLIFYPYQSPLVYTPFLEATLMPEKKKKKDDKYGGRIVKTDYQVFDTYNLITIYLSDGKYVKIATNKENQIIYYENKFVEVIKRKFLEYNDSMLYLNLGSVRIIKSKFLYQNNTLLEMNAPMLVDMDSNCMPVNRTLYYLYAPYLTNVGNNTLWRNPNIRFDKNVKNEVNTPRVKNTPEFREQVELQRKREYKSFFDKNNDNK